VLAPVYIASISITGEDVAQGYILAAPATEKIYLPLAAAGDEAPAMQTRNGSVPSALRRTKTFDKVAAFGQIA
jgi:hypothetical protein